MKTIFAFLKGIIKIPLLAIAFLLILPLGLLEGVLNAILSLGDGKERNWKVWHEELIMWALKRV